VSGAVVAAPPGYTRAARRGATIVARNDALDGVLSVFDRSPTLDGWAATVPSATRFCGRGIAYGVRLPNTAIDVVVRHAWHGGVLAPFTRDWFAWPGRAPWELEAAERLRGAGVRTPAVIAYALYPMSFGRCRCDVVVERVLAGADLPEAWLAADPAGREGILRATGALLRALGSAGAHHEDLNVKNILLTRRLGTADAAREAAWDAHALDVDRVRFHAPGDARVVHGNIARLTRSLRKARTQFGIEVSEADIAALLQHAADSEAAA